MTSKIEHRRILTGEQKQEAGSGETNRRKPATGRGRRTAGGCAPLVSSGLLLCVRGRASPGKMAAAGKVMDG